MSFLPTQAVIDQATVDTLEAIIAECKKKRESIVDLDLGPFLGAEFGMKIRNEGFRGALAWVEGLCCEEINRVRGVVKDESKVSTDSG